MLRQRRWRRARRRGVSEVIGAVFLIALTVVAGAILWSFRIYTPPSPPSITFVVRSGGANPVWGDPTDCQPQGYNLSYFYPSPISNTKILKWLGSSNDGPNKDTWWGQCENGVTGNFSALNSTEFIIDSHSSSSILLTQIEFTFVCNNASNLGGTTILVQGSLASMTWFPGLSTEPAPDAPYLGYCGNFNAASRLAANGIYYNRLGIFEPLNQGVTTLENGDTFILYIHNGGYPLDFECVANAAGVMFSGENATNGCMVNSHGNPVPVPQLDYDDYHGAPPWCFLSQTACTIYLTYTGYPSTVLATIPVFSLAPSHQ
jgi:flagellin-like protein